MTLPKQPVIDSLLKVLSSVADRGQARFIDILVDCKSCTIATRYIRYALRKGFIKIAKEYRGRGRYPIKVYEITEKGRKLLEVFEE